MALALPLREPRGPGGNARFSPELMYAAASLYYNDGATQAQIADQLGTSRATVSRLLSEARSGGIVRISVVAPGDDEALAGRTAEKLGLDAVYLEPLAPPDLVGVSLAPALGTALAACRLSPGDVLLMSSGRTIYDIAQTELQPLPGVVVVPTVGGQNEPEAWYQTNEITRLFAEKVGGQPRFLYAPALPGADLHERLVADPSVAGIMELWERAACAVLGVGAPLTSRGSIPNVVAEDALELRHAVGDMCDRFFDQHGVPLAFPGSERLIATSLEMLRQIPATIAVAAGREKVPGLLAAAQAGWFNQLVTDAPTASALIAAVDHVTPA